MRLKRRRGESRGINTLDIRLRMGHTWTANSFLHHTEENANASASAGAWPAIERGGDMAEPEEEGVQSLWTVLPTSSKADAFLAITWLLRRKGLALLPGGPRNLYWDACKDGSQTKREEPSQMWQPSQGQRFTGCSTDNVSPAIPW
jgi:hypothetical protein